MKCNFLLLNPKKNLFDAITEAKVKAKVEEKAASRERNISELKNEKRLSMK